MIVQTVIWGLLNLQLNLYWPVCVSFRFYRYKRLSLRPATVESPPDEGVFFLSLTRQLKTRFKKVILKGKLDIFKVHGEHKRDTRIMYM